MISWFKKAFALHQPTDSSSTLIAEFAIAGLQHYRGDDLAELVQIGDALSLHEEPHNAFDSNAVMIMWNNNKMGYIPASLAKDVRRRMRDNSDIIATITDVKPVRFGRQWLRVRLCTGE